MRKWIQRIKRLIDMLRDKPEPPQPPPQPQPQPEVGSNRFLWKPVSESRPGAAILLPARIERAIITANGETPAENRGRTNGNRLTYFMAKTGAAYGSNVKVRAYDGTDLIQEWTVPNGADRYEK